MSIGDNPRPEEIWEQLHAPVKLANGIILHPDGNIEMPAGLSQTNLAHLGKVTQTLSDTLASARLLSLLRILLPAVDQLEKAGFLEVPYIYSHALSSPARNGTHQWGTPIAIPRVGFQYPQMGSPGGLPRDLATAAKKYTEKQFYLTKPDPRDDIVPFGQNVLFFHPYMFRPKRGRGEEHMSAQLATRPMGLPINNRLDIVITEESPLSDEHLAKVREALEGPDDEALLTMAALSNPKGLEEQRNRWRTVVLRTEAPRALKRYRMTKRNIDQFNSAYKQVLNENNALPGDLTDHSQRATIGYYPARQPNDTETPAQYGWWWQGDNTLLAPMRELGEELAWLLNQSGHTPRWEALILETTNTYRNTPTYCLFLGVKNAPWEKYWPIIVGSGTLAETLSTRPATIIARFE